MGIKTKSSKERVAKRVTRKPGKYVVKVYEDQTPRKRVKQALGDNVKRICVVNNGYTKWGSHLVLRHISNTLKKPYVLSKGDPVKGWVYVNVRAAELCGRIAAVSKQVSDGCPRCDRASHTARPPHAVRARDCAYRWRRTGR